MATAKKSAKKTTAKKSAAKKAPAKKQAGKKTAARGKGGDNYTKPELREKIKAEVVAGDKGGRPGQWSARKAQLVLTSMWPRVEGTSIRGMRRSRV